MYSNHKKHCSNDLICTRLRYVLYVYSRIYVTVMFRSTFAQILRPGLQIFTGTRLVENLCTNMSKKTAILLIADGSEEMEAVITADVLRRAGVLVTIASVTDNECVKCSRDVKVCADTKLLNAINNQKYDVVIMPGGLGGSKVFASSMEVGKLLQEQEKENRVIAAICAAPTALKAHGIGKGKQVTSYPAMKDQLVDEYKYLEEKVVIDGNLITSRGPATAFAFGLAIVEKLLNKESAGNVAKGMLYEDYK